MIAPAIPKTLYPDHRDFPGHPPDKKIKTSNIPTQITKCTPTRPTRPRHKTTNTTDKPQAKTTGSSQKARIAAINYAGQRPTKPSHTA